MGFLLPEKHCSEVFFRLQKNSVFQVASLGDLLWNENQKKHFFWTANKRTVYSVSHRILAVFKAPSTRIQVFLNPQLFLSGFKNFSVHTYRIQIEFARPHASDGIRIHYSTEGPSALKCLQSMHHRAHDAGNFLCLLLAGMLCRILVFCSVRDWTRFCYVIGFENIRILPSTRYRIFFSTLVRRF